MSTVSLTQNATPVKIDFLFVATDETDVSQLPDDIYPFDGGEDRWAVVMNGQMVNWASEWGKACSLYVLALRVNREHYTKTLNAWGRAPAQEIPFDGSTPDEPLAYGDELIFASQVRPLVGSADQWPDDYGLEGEI